MNGSQEITMFDDVIEILEEKIHDFQVYKVDSKEPDYAYTVGQINGLLLAQTLLLQLQRNQNNKP